MADWTSLPDTAVGIGGLPSGTTVTALRDNPVAIAEGAVGAPRVVGAIYAYEEFTSSGTWTKPSDAAPTDKVMVQAVGGGGSGGVRSDTTSRPGCGGAGAFYVYLMSELPATMVVEVGAGGAQISTTNGNGNSGGASRFGPAATDLTLTALGGPGGTQADQETSNTIRLSGVEKTLFSTQFNSTSTITGFRNSEYGGGGGGAGPASNQLGGTSVYAGNGGDFGNNANSQPGTFPGGGGGRVINASTTRVGGAGADGVVRVWCMREAPL